MHAPVDMALSGFDFVIVLCMGQHGVTCSGLAVCVHHYSDTSLISVSLLSQSKSIHITSL